jgi:hypothetical protein
MKLTLLRLATLYFDPAPQREINWTIQTNDDELKVLGSWKPEGKLRLLVAGITALSSYPDVDDRNSVIVPIEARKITEATIEAFANLVSISEMCSRSISSPTPWVAFIPEDADAGRPNRRKPSLHNPRGAGCPELQSPRIRSPWRPPQYQPIFLRGCCGSAGCLIERALLAASELEPQRFQRQLQIELESGSAREVQCDGQVLLEAVGCGTCTGWRSATSKASLTLDACCFKDR